MNWKRFSIMRATTFCVLGFACALFTGCSRVEVTGENCFPPGSKWKTCQFRLVVEIDGQYGRSFVAETKKDVHISLYKGTQKSMSTNDVVYGGAIDWQVGWFIEDKIVQVNLVNK